MRKWMRALAAALVCMCTAAQAVEKLPIETFSHHYTYDTAEISPGGTKLAVSYLRDDTEFLALVDLATDKVAIVSSVKRPDSILGVWWKSDDRLIYRIFAHGRDDSQFPLYYATNADGSKRVPLNFNWQRNGRILFYERMDAFFAKDLPSG